MSDGGLLRQLHAALVPHIPTIEKVESGLEARLETRYGILSLVFDHDPAARSVRAYTLLPPPAGAGSGFFNWCLAMNTLYWDAKVGLDAQGMLLGMADVDRAHLDAAAAAQVLLTRVSAMCELIDDDLILSLLAHNLATPAQRERWMRVGDDEPA